MRLYIVFTPDHNPKASKGHTSTIHGFLAVNDGVRIFTRNAAWKAARACNGRLIPLQVYGLEIENNKEDN